MGLWLKCPGCQTKNPLFFEVCPQCGRSLKDLPAKDRVYVVGPVGPLTEKPAPGPAPAVVSPAAAPAEAPAKAGKKPRPAKKKKG
jgi:hypothetical protein